MRHENPSQHWLRQFDKAFIAHGGHNGPQTLAVCRKEYAIPLYQKGATPAAAGFAALTAYRLYNQAALLEEKVEGILADVRAGRVPLEVLDQRANQR